MKRWLIAMPWIVAFCFANGLAAKLWGFAGGEDADVVYAGYYIVTNIAQEYPSFFLGRYLTMLTPLIKRSVDRLRICRALPEEVWFISGWVSASIRIINGLLLNLFDQLVTGIAILIGMLPSKFELITITGRVFGCIPLLQPSVNA